MLDPQSAPRRTPSRYEPTDITRRASIVEVAPLPREGDGVRTLSGHASSVRSVAFSPDGRLLATGGFDHAAALWNPADGTRIAWLRGHVALINSVAFSPDGTRLATGSFDGTVRVWDMSTPQQVLELTAGALCILSRGVRTVRSLPRAAPTRESGCGTWPPANSPRYSPDTSKPWNAWPSRRTAGSWPRLPGTGTSFCGMRGMAREQAADRYTASPARWRSRPMAGLLLWRVGPIRLCSSGMSRPGRSK